MFWHIYIKWVNYDRYTLVPTGERVHFQIPLVKITPSGVHLDVEKDERLKYDKYLICVHVYSPSKKYQPPRIHHASYSD